MPVTIAFRFSVASVLPGIHCAGIAGSDGAVMSAGCFVFSGWIRGDRVLFVNLGLTFIFFVV